MSVPGVFVHVHHGGIVFFELEGSVFSEEAGEGGAAWPSVEPQDNRIVVWVILTEWMQVYLRQKM